MNMKMKAKKLINAIGVKGITFLSVGLLIGLGTVFLTKPSIFGFQRTTSVNPSSLSDIKPDEITSQATTPAQQNLSDETSNQSSNIPTSNSPTYKPSSTTQPSTNSSTPTQNTAPATPQCNQALKNSAESSRDSAIAYENAKHNNWKYGGSYDSSYYYDAKAQEDARHEAELARIEQKYQQDLAAAHCN